MIRYREQRDILTIEEYRKTGHGLINEMNRRTPTCSQNCLLVTAGTDLPYILCPCGRAENPVSSDPMHMIKIRMIDDVPHRLSNTRDRKVGLNGEEEYAIILQKTIF